MRINAKDRQWNLNILSFILDWLSKQQEYCQLSAIFSEDSANIKGAVSLVPQLVGVTLMYSNTPMLKVFDLDIHF